ncbi:MAG: GNAT family N-acetyltransferase [Oscillospiraceae bacterium]|nr:GNAT family N-acetyltransferase [Oscillospiraceae bacterium]
MSHYKKIVGEKVYLSPMSEDSVESYTKWLNDSAVSDGLATSHFQVNLLSEKKWLTESLENESQQYSIITLKENRLVGHIGLEELCHIQRVATVGIFIGEQGDRSMGYGSEALSLMMGYCFGVLNLNNLMLRVLPFNEAAIKAYTRLGFREFGRRRAAYYLNNQYHDLIHMDITKQDFYS